VESDWETSVVVSYQLQADPGNHFVVPQHSFVLGNRYIPNNANKMRAKNKGEHKELRDPFPSLIMYNDVSCLYLVAPCITM
jgi:hypothetical protein